MPYRDKEKQRAYNREWMRMRRAGESGTPGGTPLPLPFRLKAAEDVLRLIEEQVNAVREDKEAGTLEKARVIGYLASIALKAVEVANLEARIEVLEQALERQRGEIVA